MSRKVERSSGRAAIRRYLAEVRTIPRLTRDEEITLGERIAAGHRDCMDALVLANLVFVVQIATRYVNRGLPLEDLLNEGNIGLMKAASRYDHTKGLKFITYAAWWVRKSILQALDEHGSLVRVPAYQREKMTNPARIHDAVSGHEPSQLTSGHARVVSLETPLPGPGAARVADRLADSIAEDPEREMLLAEELSLLRSELSVLDARELVVITWRFGLQDEKTLTLNEIGEELGLSRERVRQIEKSACLKLRGRFRRVFDRSSAHSVANRSPERLHAVTQPQ